MSMVLRQVGEGCVGVATGIDVGAAGIGLVAVGQHRIGHAPVGPDLGIVPGHTELVGRVVVAVDEIGDRHVGEGGEPVGDVRAG